jgi:hypothetical protein
MNEVYFLIKITCLAQRVNRAPKELRKEYKSLCKNFFTHKYQFLLLTVPVNILSQLGFQSFLFPTYFTEQIAYAFLKCSMCTTCSANHIVLYFVILSIFDEGKNNYTPPQLNLFTAFRLFRPPRSKYQPPHTVLSLKTRSFNVRFPVFGTILNQNPRKISENLTYHTHTHKTKNIKQERSDIK